MAALSAGGQPAAGGGRVGGRVPGGSGSATSTASATTSQTVQRKPRRKGSDMSTQTETPAGEPTIVMTRIYEAPRDLVWRVSTQPEHIRKWWGGPRLLEPGVRDGPAAGRALETRPPLPRWPRHAARLRLRRGRPPFAPGLAARRRRQGAAAPGPYSPRRRRTWGTAPAASWSSASPPSPSATPPSAYRLHRPHRRELPPPGRLPEDHVRGAPAMTNPLHALAVDTFVPMLESLAALLDKAAAHAATRGSTSATSSTPASPPTCSRSPSRWRRPAVTPGTGWPASPASPRRRWRRRRRPSPT